MASRCAAFGASPFATVVCAMVRIVSMGAFFDGGLSELFEGVPVPVPMRYRGEREPELEEAGTIGQISPTGRTQGRVSAHEWSFKRPRRQGRQRG